MREVDACGEVARHGASGEAAAARAGTAGGILALLPRRAAMRGAAPAMHRIARHVVARAVTAEREPWEAGALARLAILVVAA
jgi:hypothetical protein